MHNYTPLAYTKQEKSKKISYYFFHINNSNHPCCYQYTPKHQTSCIGPFEVVCWERGHERTEKRTQKIETACLERSLSRDPAGVTRKRGEPVGVQLHKERRRTALDRSGSGK